MGLLLEPPLLLTQLKSYSRRSRDTQSLYTGLKISKDTRNSMNPVFLSNSTASKLANFLEMYIIIKRQNKIKEFFY